MDVCIYLLIFAICILLINIPYMYLFTNIPYMYLFINIPYMYLFINIPYMYLFMKIPSMPFHTMFLREKQYTIFAFKLAVIWIMHFHMHTERFFTNKLPITFFTFQFLQKFFMFSFHV